ncbi:MAG: pentapeptide repeat-containing protein [Oscillospiraceae bacterium]
MAIKKNKRPSFILEMDECNDLLQLIKDKYENEEDIINVHIKDVSLSEKQLNCLTFENVILENCSLKNCSMKKTSFQNVIFKSCDFSNCDFSDNWFNTCDFINTKAVGTSFADSKLTFMHFENSNFKYANFTKSNFDNCEIIGSDMTETFFAQSKFKMLSLANSKFIGTEFFKTSLNDIDFSTCELQGIRVSETAEELRGAIVNTYQAADLAKLLGIVIKED